MKLRRLDSLQPYLLILTINRYVFLVLTDNVIYQSHHKLSLANLVTQIIV